MEKDNIKKIISAYFGKSFSKAGINLFGRWLRTEESASEKVEALRTIWDNSTANASPDTREDWNILQRRLYTMPSVRTAVPLYRQIMRYVAVALLTLLATSAVYQLTDRSEKQIRMAEFFVPYGESRMVTLPDSSKVWVDSGSLLVYPADFSDMKTRSVYLTGKASFTVRTDKAKPFIVKTTYVDVEALGTVFTVNSYPADLFTSATLEKGSVQVDVKGDLFPSSVLKPNEQLVYSHKEHTVNIYTVDASFSEMERAGYLIFDNVSFAQLMSSLERKFNVVIQSNSQKYNNQYYNVKFAPDESIEQVLAVLQQLTGLQYKIKKNVVFIN